MLRRLLCATTVLMLGLMGEFSVAERSSTFGKYTVHYNVLTTDLLEPSVAHSYNISRSRQRALLNVAVLKRVMGTTGRPVTAKVHATATNLSAQLREIEMRELREGGAIYYLGQFSVNNEETFKFTLQVTPEGETESHRLSFQQQFFTR